MKKILRIVIGIAIIGIFAWTIIFLVNKSKDVPQVFNTTTADYRDIIKKTVATGSMVPENETEIIPQVSGIVEEIYVKAGDKVKKGALIAKVRIIPNIEKLNAATAQVDQAKIALNDAKKTYERKQSLFKDGVISKADFQKADFDYEKAKENLDAAYNHVSIVKDGISKDAGQSTNTLVKSTITGMVLDVPVEEGFSVIEANTFNKGSVIATVADMKKMIFEGTVDETEVGKIHPGMKLILNVGAIDELTFDATLSYISPKGRQENSAIVFDIEAEVELNDSVFIRAGYSANADIVLDRKNKVLAIKEKNLLFDKETVFVEVEKDSLVFEKRTVVLGISDGIYSEIVSGLDTNTKIKVQE